MDKVLDDVLDGEDVIVQHRFKEPVRITSAKERPRANVELAGLHAFESAPKLPSTYDPEKSVKDLYSESITKKYVE